MKDHNHSQTSMPGGRNFKHPHWLRPSRLNWVAPSSPHAAASSPPQEENAKLCDVLMRWLLGEAGVRLPRRREYEVSESRSVPNTESLADRLRCCLQVTWGFARRGVDKHLPKTIIGVVS